ATLENQARIVWGGASPHRADALVALPGDPGERDALTDAVEFLQDVLRAGPLPSREVQRMARDAGHSTRTVERAKPQAGVRAVKRGFGSSGEWVWELRASPDGNNKRGGLSGLNGLNDGSITYEPSATPNTTKAADGGRGGVS